MLFINNNIGYNGIAVNLEIIQNLEKNVKKKWKKIGLALNLSSSDLNKWDGKSHLDSFQLMLSLWKQKKNNYTWSALFKALTSVQEKAAADLIMSECNNHKIIVILSMASI